MSKNKVRKYIAESINLKDIYYDLVRSKTKTTTIRYGHMLFKDLETSLTFSSKPPINIIIKKLDYSKTFSDLEKADAISDGYDSVETLKNDLKKYYPDIKKNSPLTIISFDIID
ncbi:ASCH domain-containing protein [Mangrovivirga sp. M17]|uniref:ASCH domain-containing protein n=1 Tax=Mangrovivirga halotolerans TaxID=2993936 RepID=A0ABT3RUM0_9BACT|nr:ASCH domain-containing protein [Mangrovivirga halotolerans]MCX2745469.1 ASCH domain-containing protein [Mangrovivirga halotolerans]